MRFNFHIALAALLLLVISVSTTWAQPAPSGSTLGTPEERAAAAKKAIEDSPFSNLRDILAVAIDDAVEREKKLEAEREARLMEMDDKAFSQSADPLVEAIRMQRLREKYAEENLEKRRIALRRTLREYFSYKKKIATGQTDSITLEEIDALSIFEGTAMDSNGNLLPASERNILKETGRTILKGLTEGDIAPTRLLEEFLSPSDVSAPHSTTLTNSALPNSVPRVRSAVYNPQVLAAAEAISNEVFVDFVQTVGRIPTDVELAQGIQDRFVAQPAMTVPASQTTPIDDDHAPTRDVVREWQEKTGGVAYAYQHLPEPVAASAVVQAAATPVAYAPAAVATEASVLVRQPATIGRPIARPAVRTLGAIRYAAPVAVAAAPIAVETPVVYRPQTVVARPIVEPVARPVVRAATAAAVTTAIVRPLVVAPVRNVHRRSNRRGSRRIGRRG